MVQRPAGQPSHEEELRSIGLEAEWVRAAIGNGNRERVHVLGNHHSLGAQGFYAWDGILSSLTLSTRPEGWKRHDPRSLPVLLNAETKTLLFVSSGDAYTGLQVAGKSPRSRNPKGAIVKTLSNQNKALHGNPLPLDLQEPEDQRFIREILGYTSYVLLVHFSRKDCEARYEVSRLGDIDSRNLLRVLQPRMIGPAYALSEEDFDTSDPNEGLDGPGEFDVPPKS